MNNYRTILIAIDLSKESHKIVERAASIAKSHSSETHIIHVIEPISMFYNNNILVDLSHIERETEYNAKIQLQKIGDEFLISTDHQHLMLGSPAKQIHALADSLGADLVVVGTHGRSGISLLLGSTANSVLHGSKCDVLAVRVTTN